MNARALNLNKSTTGIHPLKFTLWLLIMSIIMMFAAFTSAYIVRREEGNWLEFNLPNGLLINSILIAVSSIAMQWAYISAKKDNLNALKVALLLTFSLGVAFLIGQWNVWGELVTNKIFFGGPTANPSGSFMYVLTGVHGFHLITGLIFLLIVILAALRYRVHAKNLLQMELCTTYWHFLGALWVYLYVFLAVYH
ncbi:cytochrome oxidase subunit III [Adhaeribacter arboris]|uniref:Cytochrome oxidase subunit III n=1 Tax=Adhaeribacter arboris TaxID=2072846 RepID=A0A2T2YMT2_9BACT|nr:cytochrome c oxidase subunit 3 [Adhaeribacter arboris]PSR56817.1 cytochrome oxidase subunit III [Adhaeribacter arboris]